jgi:chromosomal replication initiation ATPase DnaA
MERTPNTKQLQKLQQLLKIVSDVTGVQQQDIIGKRRTEKFVIARMLLFSAARKCMKITYYQMVPFFNLTEHSTLCYYSRIHARNIKLGEDQRLRLNHVVMYLAHWKHICDLIDESPGLKRGMKRVKNRELTKRRTKI